MDTKLKNSNKTKLRIVVTALLIFAIISVSIFPAINQKARRLLEADDSIQTVYEEIDKDLLERLYAGCYVLYLENVLRQATRTAADVYLDITNKGENTGTADKLVEQVDGWLENAARKFEEYRSDIDYCIPLGENQYEKNTTRQLDRVISDARHDNLAEYYSDYFVLKFDAQGNLKVDSVYDAKGREDSIIKALGQVERDNSFWGSLKEEYAEYGVIANLKKPVDFTVIYGIPKDSEYQIFPADGEFVEGINADYWEIMNVSIDAGAYTLYFVMLALTAVLVWVMTSRRVWKTEISMERPKKCYLMEAAAAGILWTLCMQDPFAQMTWSYDFLASYGSVLETLGSGRWISVVADVLVIIFEIFMIYGVWYLSLRFVRPVFTLGFREYIRQYSIIYQIYPWIQKKWNAFKEEIGHLDFSEKSTKTIVKIVVLNFVVLAVCSMMWFFGIIALVVYSVILFFIIRKYYDKAGKDYQALLRGVGRIAEGDLDAPITEDIGMFEPFRAELSKIQTGFKKAVDEEVKSQRMKTELITNVSHDLKTPLTAITTYVELLKKEDITEEERRSYIGTLEKKSLRLKVLIEDLFEVSKATSNNIILNPVEMDVVNLLKQVSIEHTEKFEQLGLDLRWNVPEEKAIRMLDTQKTYRIFENLFGNIQKYAMPGSRVYVDVSVEGASVENYTSEKTGTGNDTAGNDSVENNSSGQEAFREKDCHRGHVQIVMKNMSAQELNVKAEEITERFVRGDSSRNTEGSGLGLAIAKSFTEAQGGKFMVEVDGDLFKVVIVF